ncbi:MAG: glycyl-radical enzyme activating protein [Coriobacteriales bacterium]|jgi:pyruvate formate lyase activating enzyme|nr:glycyl-radical enzyme activating protein [Coriobacteriales bacterium]
MTDGVVFDIQRYSVNDGPGIRTTVFLKGCPLRCPWCHSPESQDFKPQIALKRMSCRGTDSCGLCLPVCKADAMRTIPFTKYVEGEPRELRIPDIDTALCTSCFDCAEVCPPGALYVCGEERAPEDVLEEVLRDREYYEKSGGGMTISGGEPLCQPDFCRDLLGLAKGADLTTAVDTSGFVPWAHIEKVLDRTDLFLLDIKSLNPELHLRVVGVPNELILENARKLSQASARIWVRIPIIPQFNDSDDSCIATADFIASLGEAVELVQLLPYHNMGTYKYERIFWRKPIFEAPVPKDERMAEILALFVSRNIPAKIH